MIEKVEIKSRKGAVAFTIDSDNAFLLRNYSWNLNFGKTNRPFLQRTVSKGVTEVITRVIAKPRADEIVIFTNGDSTDLRRANLECVKKSKGVAKAGAKATLAKRKPNRIKLTMVLSDSSKVEGIFACTDHQWKEIQSILSKSAA